MEKQSPKFFDLFETQSKFNRSHHELVLALSSKIQTIDQILAQNVRSINNLIGSIDHLSKICRDQSAEIDNLRQIIGDQEAIIRKWTAN